ncbi:MAG: hypothetical protein NTW53_07685 [Burkholderiales bacterium]|nr:hypothetical protein [Burkholderiales bacterium]
MADLLHLRHGKVCLDVVPVSTCVEKPSWAVFTGETCFQSESPTFMACLMALRERIDEEDVETMLMATIDWPTVHFAPGSQRTPGGRGIDRNVHGCAASDRFEIAGEIAPVSDEVGDGQRSESSQRLQLWTSRIAIQIPSCANAGQFVGIGKSMLMPKTVVVNIFTKAPNSSAWVRRNQHKNAIVTKRTISLPLKKFEVSTP